MWPHEIDALYRWYCTLPATIILFGTMVAIIGARESYAASRHVKSVKTRFKFDENDVALLSPFLWLFGVIFIRSLAWFRGGFSEEGQITAFYSFYVMVLFSTVTCLFVVLFYRPCMKSIDVLQSVFSWIPKRIGAFYGQHGASLHVVIPLSLVAISIMAVEKLNNYAFLYKWYYVGPTIIFFYVFLALQWLGAMDYYADEHAGYYRRRVQILSLWLTVLSLVLVIWIGVYETLQVERGAAHLTLYAPTLFYGATVWALCAVFCTWLATLFLFYVYGINWIRLRKLSKQLIWAQCEQKAAVCFRIRRIGGEQATQVLVDAVHNGSLNMAARLAAARELSETDWKPANDQDLAWLAVGGDQWNVIVSMKAVAMPLLIEILAETLHSPRNAFDGDQLSLVINPTLKAIGEIADPQGLELLVQAVKLRYESEGDTSRLIGTQTAENPNYLEVVATRCEAARALRAMGPVAAPCARDLKEVLNEEGLDPNVGEEVACALAAIGTT